MSREDVSTTSESESDTRIIDFEDPFNALHEIINYISSDEKIKRNDGICKLNTTIKLWEIETNMEKVTKQKKLIKELVITNIGTFDGSSRFVEIKIVHLKIINILISLDIHDLIFLENVKSIALKLMLDNDYKVQLICGETLGLLSKYIGITLYKSSRDILIEPILKYLQADVIRPEDELLSPEQGFDLNISASQIKTKILHEATEWKHLEPHLKCLKIIIENLKSNIVISVDQQLLDITIRCLIHTNRYVREIGYQICAELIPEVPPEKFKEFEHEFLKNLINGLSDNWNQVRLAALSTTRKLFIMQNSKENYFNHLLPPLCLNRYYKSEGVRIYAEDTWKSIVGTNGRLLVGKYINNVINFYIEACKSTNPTQREASCFCISELGQKIEQNIIKPFIEQLLESLLICCNDTNSSVQDAACLAFGDLTNCYPNDCKPHLQIIYKILFNNLQHPSSILRQGAAAALSSIVNSYGEDVFNIVLDILSNGLNNSEELDDLSQCTNCELDINIGSNASASATNIIQSNSEKFKIVKPWHLTDGCIYLMGALAETSKYQGEILKLFPIMIATAKNGQNLIILETICKNIPLVAKGTGKKEFKQFLEIIFDPIFNAMESQCYPTIEAAQHCLSFLVQFIGPNILKSRIQLHNPRFVHYLDGVHQTKNTKS